MNNKPLLSIVIATKNRVFYCIHAIETILKLSSVDFELIVQDNTDTLELKEYVDANVKDTRFVYNYTPPPFSSIDNFNAAITLASGEYLCLIGDDDTVLPNIIEVTQWAKNNNIDSVCPSFFIEYFWPNAIPQFPTGLLQIPSRNSGLVAELDASNQLAQFLSNGAIDYLNYSLPKIYHGIIKKDCMDMVKKKTGHYFGGLSPDTYAAASLSLVVQKHVTLAYPLTIAGVCAKSTTAESSQGKHSGRYEDTPHLRDRSDYLWDAKIPKFYSVETIWAETACTAIREMGSAPILNGLNYPKFIAAAILRNEGIKNIVFDAIRENMSTYSLSERIVIYMQAFFFYMYGFSRRLASKCYQIFKKQFRRETRIEHVGIENISLAVETTSAFLDKAPLKLSVLDTR